VREIETLSVAIPNEKRVMVKRNIITNRASAVRVSDKDRAKEREKEREREIER